MHGPTSAAALRHYGRNGLPGSVQIQKEMQAGSMKSAAGDQFFAAPFLSICRMYKYSPTTDINMNINANPKPFRL